MDIILNWCDEKFFTPHVYPESFPADNPWRQALSLYAISAVGGYALYFIVASLSYYFLFEHELKKHPRFLENQVEKEIAVAVRSIPIMGLFTLPFFMTEILGYTKLYDNVETYGWPYYALSVFMFFAFNDCCVYWIHRWLHHPAIYKYIHKEHHRWLIPTPFAAYAFHPFDGFVQSVPYHIFIFLFPMHKATFLVLFVVVNLWTASIHDELYLVPKSLWGILNCAAHHTDHHLFYNYNYGLYFTLWDRIGGSYRVPSPFEGVGPFDDLNRLDKEGKISLAYPVATSVTSKAKAA